MKFRGFFRVALIALAAWTLLGGVGALAAPRVEIPLPMLAKGADCTAVLTDADGNPVQTLALVKGVESYMTVVCETMDTRTFHLKLTDVDTSDITYDKAAYDVVATPYYRDDGEPAGLIEIKPAGDIASPKREIAEFDNIVRTRGGGGGGGTSPKTDDERNLGLWVGASGGILAVIAVLLVYYFRPRRKEKRSK